MDLKRCNLAARHRTDRPILGRRLAATLGQCCSRSFFRGLIATLAVLLIAGESQADLILSGATSTQSATVDFSLDTSGTQHVLTIVLTNTSPAGTGGTQVLTQLLFDTAHVSELTPVSATASGILGSYPSGVTSIGSNWAYQATTQNAGSPALNTEISTTGVSATATPPTSAYFATDKPPLDGPNYGIVSTAYGSSAGGFKILAQDSITFKLNAANSFSLSEIGNGVIFTFGTGSDFTNLPSGPGPNFETPEPTSVALWGGLLALAGVVSRRRRNAA